MKKLAVLTSGGDAPGMNAAIRAVVRRGIEQGLDVYGVYNGYEGLLEGHIEQMQLGSVGDIIHRGGTMLRTSRSERFKTEEGQQQGIEQLEKLGIEGLVVIGGDGSFQGAKKLGKKGLPVIGIPGTIDNDIAGTEYSIGFSTAVSTAVEAIDKIRDTAYSHEKTTIVEVMGRGAGDIALWAGLCAGAESILIPETPYHIEDIIERMKRGRERGKMHNIIVVAEGVCKAEEISEEIKKRIQLETRVMVLGYLQRGGNPSVYDRMIGSQMGAKAVDLLIEGQHGCMIAVTSGKVIAKSFEQAEKEKHEIDMSLYQLARSLSI
ncbi:6-phosphofructokinase [Neobacillus mesonae]|uniref:6-phosphofructokinase n=1 Tax=Neobacillus mesonae TaxID=1193713 RepID=UPI002040FFB8|nr:6-phosphofructokinase [Neobacillus mesonae]MCM3569502.1 6-phosphofructokinase [Neobacillus mesonae]